jgi:hypothetical protein
MVPPRAQEELRTVFTEAVATEGNRKERLQVVLVRGHDHPVFSARGSADLGECVGDARESA